MANAREKFRALTRVFDPIYQPRQDAADGPGTSYVPETHEDYRKQLEAALDLNDSAKLLVAGQPGCGKTTLLLNIADTLRKDGRLVAFVDLEAQAAVQDLGSVEMYLAALAALLSEVHKSGGSLAPETIAACQSWLARSQLGADATPDPEAIVAALRRQLAIVRESKPLRDELRLLVKQDSGTDPFSLLCRALEDLEARRPVVILDGLDKLLPSRARETFLDDKKKPMAEAPGAAILTIPLSLVYEPTFNVLSERYNNADSAVLPAVRVWDFDAQKRKRAPSEKGIDILRKILSARVDPIDPQIVMPDAVERVIVGSGGNIRELARLMQSSVIKAHVRHGDFVEVRDIEAAIADQRESFRRGYDARFLPLLQRVRNEYRLDDSGDIAKQLLYGLWVIEYRNGSAWYSLPEPVEQLLRHLERTPK
ncbi:MAG: AAA family ATPase [Minicystis sp.]